MKTWLTPQRGGCGFSQEPLSAPPLSVLHCHTRLPPPLFSLQLERHLNAGSKPLLQATNGFSRPCPCTAPGPDPLPRVIPTSTPLFRPWQPQAMFSLSAVTQSLVQRENEPPVRKPLTSCPFPPTRVLPQSPLLPQPPSPPLPYQTSCYFRSSEISPKSTPHLHLH